MHLHCSAGDPAADATMMDLGVVPFGLSVPPPAQRASVSVVSAEDSRKGVKIFRA